MGVEAARSTRETLRTLPGDDVRQIMWRFADRFDLQMVVQSARSVARGPVARLVADGARNTHDWTEQKATLLSAFDESGITAVGLDTDTGGFLEGPKNMAFALVALELAWVDAGAATCSLASNLALAPINERGTAEQRHNYMSHAAPAKPGEDRETWRGAFILTEPLPYVGADAAMLGGKVRVVEWEEGGEPLLQVDKRGRFITNMAFANFATAAVASDDERIKGTCMVILEETDPGLFDPGAPTQKLVQQISATSDPILSLKVPASRIVGGYTVKDGIIVPKYNHSEIIEAVFRRTRIPVGLMTSAKLLSAVEPVTRYQRGRFRGGEDIEPGSPRHDLGLQKKEDALHRLVDIWAAGEAGASLGFGGARLFDELDPLDKRKAEIFSERKIRGARAEMKEFKRVEKEVKEYLHLSSQSEDERDQDRYKELAADELVQYSALNSLANVLSPACKLWNTGHGTNMMREALSLMGGYGITEDCPGFLGQKWMDAQLEATYEGPEAVQRRQLSVTMTNPVFLEQFRIWTAEMREMASTHPGTGACTLGTAMNLWMWTLSYLQTTKDADCQALYHSSRQGVSFPLADVLCGLLASRYLILDILELESKGPENPTVAEGLPGLLSFYTDLSHVHSAQTSGETGRVCAELVYGYQRHPAWDEDSCAGCYHTDELEGLEGIMPGIIGIAPSLTDVIDDNGLHPTKAGPCARLQGLETFVRLRSKLDGCLTGSRLAKDRAAYALTQVMIPEALDYPS